MRRQIAMLLVVAWSARNAGAETQRWKARSTKMPGGSGGMQRRARARVSGGGGNRETDARGKAGMGVGIDSKENGSSVGSSRRRMQWVV